jgi:hypothetical protein
MQILLLARHVMGSLKNGGFETRVDDVAGNVWQVLLQGNAPETRMDATLACLGCARLCSRDEASRHMKSQPIVSGQPNNHCTFAAGAYTR